MGADPSVLREAALERVTANGEARSLVAPLFRPSKDPIELSPSGNSWTLNDVDVNADGSLLFDTSGGYASTEDVVQIDRSWKLSAWVRPESYGEIGVGRIMDNHAFAIYPQLSGRTFQATVNYSKILTYAEISAQIGAWQLVAVSCRYESSDGHMYVTFYIDGIESGLEQDAGIPVAGSTPLCIGNREAGDRTFDGSVLVTDMSLGAVENVLTDIVRPADLHCPTDVIPSFLPGGWYQP